MTFQIITYHGGNSIASKIIAYFSEKKGYWKESEKKRVIECHTKIINGEKQESYQVGIAKAPSHTLCAVKINGQMRYFEADWGDAIFRPFFWWRKNGGVREVFKKDLLKRAGFHRVYEVQISEEQHAKIVEEIQRLIQNKTEYDFLGLLGSAGMIFFKRKFSKINNPTRFFCSELVQHILRIAGIGKTHRAEDTPPALSAVNAGLDVNDFVILK